MKKLGEGATAVVKLAKHIASGERVAVKIVDKKSSFWDEDSVEAFQTEVKITAKLQYKYLVSMRDFMVRLLAPLCQRKFCSWYP